MPLTEKINHLWELFKNKDLKGLSEQLKETKIKILGLKELLDSLIDSLIFVSEITNKNETALQRRLGSTSEVTRLLPEPESELTALKVRVEGMLEAEKNNTPFDADGTSGFEYGSFV